MMGIVNFNVVIAEWLLGVGTENHCGGGIIPNPGQRRLGMKLS